MRVSTKASRAGGRRCCRPTASSDVRIAVSGALLPTHRCIVSFTSPLHQPVQPQLLGSDTLKFTCKRVDLRNRRQQTVLRPATPVSLRIFARGLPKPATGEFTRRVARGSVALPSSAPALVLLLPLRLFIRNRFVVFALAQRIAAGQWFDAIEIALGLRVLRLGAREFGFGCL